MLRRWLSWGVLGVLSLALVTGCNGKGSKLVKAPGVLTWEDGTPIENASITFVPQDKKGESASAKTDKDGKFELTTKSTGDGAHAGSYKVTVTKSDASAGSLTPAKTGEDMTKAMIEWQKAQAAKAGKPKQEEIPAIYANEQSTPLKWTIEAGGPKIELKLKKS
jgi:hypothetical protein